MKRNLEAMEFLKLEEEIFSSIKHLEEKVKRRNEYLKNHPSLKPFKLGEISFFEEAPENSHPPSEPEPAKPGPLKKKVPPISKNQKKKLRVKMDEVSLEDGGEEVKVTTPPDQVIVPPSEKAAAPTPTGDMRSRVNMLNNLPSSRNNSSEDKSGRQVLQ